MDFSILHLMQTKPLDPWLQLYIQKLSSNMQSFIGCRCKHENSVLGLFTQTDAYFGLNLQEDPSWTDTMLQLCSRSQRVGPLFFIKTSLIKLMKARLSQESTCWRMHAFGGWKKNAISLVKTWIYSPQLNCLLLCRDDAQCPKNNSLS